VEIGMEIEIEIEMRKTNREVVGGGAVETP
jgi:hypothetical protein